MARRNITKKTHILLNVERGDNEKVKCRGARYSRDLGKWYIRKDYYNLKSLAPWVPEDIDINHLLKSVRRPPHNRIRNIIT